MTVAERLRVSVAATALALGSAAPSATLSMGLIVSPGTRLIALGSLVHGADRALYRAKAGGRNRCEWAGPADLMGEPALAHTLMLRGPAHPCGPMAAATPR